MSETRLILGDCVEAMAQLEPESISAVVCDPPYSLPGGFLQLAWDRHGDYQGWSKRWATEAYRLLKPGGHLLAFCATKTYHRMVAGIEDAGFEVRDQLIWEYEQGYAKGLNISQAIDDHLGVERTELIGHKQSGLDSRSSVNVIFTNSRDETGLIPIFAPATDEARTWSGWYTALRPAFEPILLARKPPVGKIAESVLLHGTGGLNINGCSDGRWPANRFHCPKTSRIERDAGLEGVREVVEGGLNGHPT